MLRKWSTQVSLSHISIRTGQPQGPISLKTHSLLDYRAPATARPPVVDPRALSLVVTDKYLYSMLTSKQCYMPVNSKANKAAGIRLVVI